MSFAAWIQQHGETLQVALFFGLFVALGILERLRPRRPGSTNQKQRWATNLGLTLLNLVVLISLPISFVVAASWAESRGWGLLNTLNTHGWVLIVATMLLRAFISWLTHLLNHKVPFLWRFHRIHHLDTELDVSTTVRGHPIEFVLSLGIGMPLVVAFGLSPWVLIAYELTDVVVTLFSHSNLKLPATLDRLLRYFIVTPDLHRIHHSSWQPETDSNYSAVFPIWDLVFGTFRSCPRDPHETIRLGLDEVRGARSQQLLWLAISTGRRNTLAKSFGWCFEV